MIDYSKFVATKNKNGVIEIKANIERKGNGDLIVHVPSLPLIHKLIKEEKLKDNNGIGHIQ